MQTKGLSVCPHADELGLIHLLKAHGWLMLHIEEITMLFAVDDHETFTATRPPPENIAFNKPRRSYLLTATN